MSSITIPTYNNSQIELQPNVSLRIHLFMTHNITLKRAFVGGPVRECPSGMKHDENGVCRPISSNSATTQATYIIIRPEANTVPVIITRPPTTATSSRRTRRPTTYNRHVKNYYHSQQ
ncbi:hypothetical protein LSTR_LSTR006386 [Laodelphax striatellus]|uniref:Uncharacterized protein n=1 Tax=Laodelphax striatellus TaxID=195883 RepID=A0A482WWM4_LAOST|nr:hypothetical protein LSTR_LSTR006386 [Laodelphax striatellus]